MSCKLMYTKVEMVFLKLVSSELGALHRHFIMYMLPPPGHRAVMNAVKVKINLKNFPLDLPLIFITQCFERVKM
jgi:hypothetical protein